MQFACLMYHFLTKSDRPRRQLYDVPLQVVRRHLDVIAARDVPVALPEELGDAEAFTLVISFDDADESVIGLGADELGERSLRAVMFVPSARVGCRGKASRCDLRRWCAMGHAIGSHTRTHRDLTRLSAREMRREIGESKAELEDMVGRPVGALSIPHGSYNRLVVCEAVRAGYGRVFTSWPGYGETERLVSGRFSILSSTRVSAVERIVGRRTVHVPQRFLYGLKRAIGSGSYRACRRRLVGVYERIRAWETRGGAEG